VTLPRAPRGPATARREPAYTSRMPLFLSCCLSPVTLAMRLSRRDSTSATVTTCGFSQAADSATFCRPASFSVC